jgi:hypothetical protein
MTTYLAGVSSGLEVVTQNEQSILDINAYTRGRLPKLRIERSLSSDWPGDPKVDELCSRAEGLFIWTALSFRLMFQEPSPTKALQRVLKRPSNPILMDCITPLSILVLQVKTARRSSAHSLASSLLPKDPSHFPAFVRFLISTTRKRHGRASS